MTGGGNTARFGTYVPIWVALLGVAGAIFASIIGAFLAVQLQVSSITDSIRAETVQRYDEVVKTSTAYVAAHKAFGPESAETKTAYGTYEGSYFNALAYATRAPADLPIFRALNGLDGTIQTTPTSEALREPLLRLVTATCEAHNSEDSCADVSTG